MIAMTSAVARATNQDLVDLDGWPQALSYNADGTLNYIDTTAPNGSVYRQTMTYSGGRLSNVSRWVKQ